MQQKNIHEQAIEGTIQVATIEQCKSRSLVQLLLFFVSIRLLLPPKSPHYSYQVYHDYHIQCKIFGSVASLLCEHSTTATKSTTTTTFSARSSYCFYHDRHSRVLPLFCRCRATAYRHHAAVSLYLSVSLRSRPNEEFKRLLAFLCVTAVGQLECDSDRHTHTDTETQRLTVDIEILNFVIVAASVCLHGGVLSSTLPPPFASSTCASRARQRFVNTH